MMHRGVNHLDTDRAFLQRFLNASTQLVFVKRLRYIVAFRDARHQQLGGLERREALGATQTLAAAANLVTFSDQARIDDLGFSGRAKRTTH